MTVESRDLIDTFMASGYSNFKKKIA